MVTKYGSEKMYRRLKPLMIGMITGDMLGGVVPSVIGAACYLITRQVTKPFHIMPG